MPPHKRNVNTVFQSYALFPFLSVCDNVAFGLKHASVSKSELRTRVGDALSLVSMSGFSGGGRRSCPAGSSSPLRYPGPWC
jgi:spermidine/putrescine transport system ATP-binding protein